MLLLLSDNIILKHRGTLHCDMMNGDADAVACFWYQVCRYWTLALAPASLTPGCILQTWPVQLAKCAAGFAGFFGPPCSGY